MKLLLGMALALSLQARAQLSDPVFESVKSWKSIGGRLAVGYDHTYTAIGVYDLSYAMPWTRTSMGTLAGPRVKTSDVLGLILKGEVESEDEALTRQAIDELSAKKDTDMDTNLLPDNWKQKVPWKSLRSASADVKEFSLADIDMAKATKDNKKFKAELDYAHSLIRDSEDLAMFGDLLSQIRIVENGKEFEIFFEPLVQANGVSKPKKIADLKNSKWGFIEAMKFELLKKSIGKLTGLILNPIVKAFVDTAFDRVFHFVKLVNYSHNQMALEVINDVWEDTGLFPRNVLTEANIETFAESLEYTDSSLLNGWKWIWKDPLKEWTKSNQKYEETAADSNDWLNGHHQNFVMLNPRFSVLPSKDLLLLALKKPDDKKGPFAAHIDGKMSPHRGARIRTEIITTAVVFGTKFVPLVGGLLKDLFKRVVEKPVDKQRYWEARMTAHLEQREAVLAENWDKELESLDGQRVNPFFKKRADVLKLIEARRTAYNIH